jgi:hypothetical protein
MILSPEQSAALVALFDKAADAKTAFGAPGDYGYGTKEGQALYGLAKALVEAHPVIVALKALKQMAESGAGAPDTSVRCGAPAASPNAEAR